MLKKILSVVVVVLVSLYLTTVQTSDIQTAYQNKQSDVQVTGSGEIVKILPDDNVGSRHQKFIVALGDSSTVLIAHNIDLAPRLNTVREGDFIEFHGEYEWNEKGGVVHWTHHDPKGKHPGGWIEFEGKRYE